MEKTAWAVYNAAVEYLDHETPHHSGTEPLYRMWMGTVEQKKRMAMHMLLEQLDANIKFVQ